MAITFAGTTTQSVNQAHLATVYYDRLALTRLTPLVPLLRNRDETADSAGCRQDHSILPA
jgi:hypothetical protein